MGRIFTENETVFYKNNGRKKTQTSSDRKMINSKPFATLKKRICSSRRDESIGENCINLRDTPILKNDRSKSVKIRTLLKKTDHYFKNN